MKILTALDHSEYSEIVLQHGLDQAVRHPVAELHFATAVSDRRDIDVTRGALEAAIRDGLDNFGLRDRPFTVHVIPGRPAPAICVLARELGADLLVIGRFHVPSESDTFLWLAPCPILVVGPEGHVIEPQCPSCEVVRRESSAERLFCARHLGGRMPNLLGRVPTRDVLVHRRWMI